MTETEKVAHETHVRIGREPGRGGERLAVVAFVLVFIAIVKPWGEAPAAETPAPRQPGVAATAPVSMGDHPCTGRRWLIQVDKRWADRTVRSWIMADDVEASGPTDPTISFVKVASPRVLGVGYCAALGDEGPRQTRLTFYRLGPPIEVVLADPVTIPAPAGPENVLFRPAATDRAPTQSGATPAPPEGWASGRYVLRIDGSDGYQRWLGLEIRITEAEPPA
jgi:hypothetical protein